MNSITAQGDRLAQLPDEARIWVYVADRDLDREHEQPRLLEFLDEFCAHWVSHGRPVQSAPAVVNDRFVVIAGMIPGSDVSGCGIDASVHALDHAGEELGITWLSSLLVHFRERDGRIRSVSRPDFRRLVESGTVGIDTPVFDVSQSHLGELRGIGFERPAGDSWHAQVFRIGAPAL